jgi:membrane-associated protein
MDAINTAIISLAGSPWMWGLVLLLIVIDGFFPFLPGESVIVALAAVGASTGLPNLWLLLLVAGLGSFLGDNIAFLIGRRVGASRLQAHTDEKVARLTRRAHAHFASRPAAVILTAKFVPVGRVAINVLAGATGFSRRSFIALSAISGAAWAVYSILVGLAAGAWVHNNPIFGMVIAVAVALTVGVLVDRVGKRQTRALVQPGEVTTTDRTTAVVLSGSRMTS